MSTIEGTKSTRINGRTGPLDIVLAKGTAGELRLRAANGFLIVQGADAPRLYDMVLGRELLEQVSGFVVPLLQQFVYMPRMMQSDLTMYTLPISVGRSRPAPYAADVTAHAAVPEHQLCGALLQDPADAGTPDLPTAASSSGEASHSSPAAANDPTPAAANTKGAAAPQSTATDTQHSSAAATTAHGWTHSLLSFFLLLLWPLSWSLQAVSKAAGALCTAANQQQPYQEKGTGKRYYRLGRHHRASDGECIQLRCAPSQPKPSVYIRDDGKHFYRLGRRGPYYRAADGEFVTLKCPPGHSGNKPRVVEVLKPRITWRYAVSALPAKAIMLMLLVLVCCFTSTAAMHTAGHLVGTDLMAHTVRLPSAPLYTAGQLHLMTLTEYVGSTFRPPP